MWWAPGLLLDSASAGARRLGREGTLPPRCATSDGLSPAAHRSFGGVEIEAKSRLRSVAQAHGSKVRGVRVHVVQGHVERHRQLLWLKKLKRAWTALEQLHDALRRALGDHLDVVGFKCHATPGPRRNRLPCPSIPDIDRQPPKPAEPSGDTRHGLHPLPAGSRFRVMRSGSEKPLATDPVRIAPYDPSWRHRFEEERNLLTDAIAAWVDGGIHHVGSTSVPGLRPSP